MRDYDTLAEFERDGYEIIVDKTYEDMHPRVREAIAYLKGDPGKLYWFMLRVRVLVEGLELASEYLGGCLYEDPKEILTDGTAEDIINMALEHAKSQVYRLSRKFTELSYAVDAEGS